MSMRNNFRLAKSNDEYITVKTFRVFLITDLVVFTVILIGIAFWFITLQNNLESEIRKSSIALCERNLPVRESTNLASQSLAAVGYGTSQFLLDAAPTLQNSELEARARVLAIDLRNLAERQVQVPINNCEEVYGNLFR